MRLKWSPIAVQVNREVDEVSYITSSTDQKKGAGAMMTKSMGERHLLARWFDLGEAKRVAQISSVLIGLSLAPFASAETIFRASGFVDPSTFAGREPMYPEGVGIGDAVEIEIRFDSKNAFIRSVTPEQNNVSYGFPEFGEDLKAKVFFENQTIELSYSEPNTKAINIANDRLETQFGATDDTINILVNESEPNSLGFISGFRVTIQSTSLPNQPLDKQLVSSTELPASTQLFDLRNFDRVFAQFLFNVGTDLLVPIRITEFEFQSSSPVKAVFFANGIRTDPLEAYWSAVELDAQYIRPNTDELYTLVTNYNKTEGGVKDLVESILQLKQISFGQALRIAVFDKAIDGVITESEYAQIRNSLIVQNYEELSQKADQARSENVLPSELRDHVNNYLLLGGNASSRGLTFAHSQGNIFTNISFQFLPRSVRDNISIVSIANPDSRIGVLQCGDHTTTVEDEVIQTIRNYASTVAINLPCDANIQNFATYSDGRLDFDGHGLLTDYTNPIYPSEKAIDAKVKEKLSDF